MQCQQRRSRTVTLSPADQASCQGSRWARAKVLGGHGLQLRHSSRMKVTESVSAVLEKLPTHYYVPVQTEECCSSYNSKLTDLQPKNLAARNESSKFNFNGHPAPALFISCIYCFYTITIYSFIKTNYCCYYCLQDIL